MIFATLSFLGSYREVEYSSRYDFDGSNPTRSLVDISGGEDERSEMSGQEVRLYSLPGGGIDWVVGFYHYRQDTVRSDIFNLDSEFVAPIPLTVIYDQAARLDSIALFGDATIPLGDRFRIICGVRYSPDAKTYRVPTPRGMAPLGRDALFAVPPPNS